MEIAIKCQAWNAMACLFCLFSGLSKMSWFARKCRDVSFLVGGWAAGKLEGGESKACRMSNESFVYTARGPIFECVFVYSTCSIGTMHTHTHTRSNFSYTLIKVIHRFCYIKHHINTIITLRSAKIVKINRKLTLRNTKII